jgi:hypothetical protein
MALTQITSDVITANVIAAATASFTWPGTILANNSITAQQIASGTITPTQISSVANTQIVGLIPGNTISPNTITPTQISSVANTQITGTVTNNVNTGSLVTGGISLGAGNASIMKNRIINGAMVIDQRNAGATGTASVYTVDRWSYTATQASKGTWGQNAGAVTPPVGFSNYLGFTSSSAYSVVAGDYFLFQQVIEGYNIADLSWGTANAKTVTLSFWVRSSLTGTFGGAIQNSGLGQMYPFSYTISTANTWEQKSITIAGSTSSTWLSTNGAGLYLVLSLGAGSTWSQTAGAWTTSLAFTATGATSVVGTNGATFYITGVQLEVGSSATGFEYRQYQQELALCMRYYRKTISGGNTEPTVYGYNIAGNNISGCFVFPVPMRATPTIATVSGSFNVSNTISPAYIARSDSYLAYSGTVATGSAYFESGTATVSFSAEL